MRRLLSAVAFALACACANLAAEPVKPDLVLRGHLDGRDNHTYRSVPFDVPAGATRITIEFSYTRQG